MSDLEELRRLALEAIKDRTSWPLDLDGMKKAATVSELLEALFELGLDYGYAMARD